MFDTVGRVTARSPRRRVGALLLALVLNGGSLGILTWIGAGAVEAVEEVEAMIERPIELVLPARGAPGPAAAPAPRSPARARASTPIAAIAAVAPPEIVPSVVPADVPPPAPLAGGSSDDGVADGALDGDGTGGGGGGGDAGPGSGGGGPGGGIKTVHWSEVAVKVRPTIRPSDYPEGAAALNLADTRCVVRIHIDERGAPYEVVPTICPTVFRTAARDIALRYRFHPLREEGRAVRAVFDLTIHFRE